MIWLVIAAQLSAPTWTNPRMIRPEDVPAHELNPNVVHSVKLGLTVTPEGKLQDCRVEVSSGNPQLDSYTCKLMMRRAKVRPARDWRGARAYGVYRTSIDWWVGDGYPHSRPQLPDLELTVAGLPAETKSPARVRLMLAVDETGRPSSCVAEGKKDHPLLVKSACDQLLKRYTAVPARTRNGVPVASIQSGIVIFKTK